MLLSALEQIVRLKLTEINKITIVLLKYAIKHRCSVKPKYVSTFLKTVPELDTNTAQQRSYVSM